MNSTKKLALDKEPKTYAFIDASNLFYGGDKSLGWRIDYKKLHTYLKERYNCKKIMYFGGIDVYKYKHNYQSNETVQLIELIRHLRALKGANTKKGNAKANIPIDKCINRAKFYKKLQDFGYTLVLKPVKVFKGPGRSRRLKANCDLDMALALITGIDKFERALVLTGDGDFLPVLKFVKHKHRDVIILARGPRTAKELKQFAGANFRDFVRLRNRIEQI